MHLQELVKAVFIKLCLVSGVSLNPARLAVSKGR